MGDLVGTPQGHNAILFTLKKGNTPHKTQEILREDVRAVVQSFAATAGEPPPPVVQYDTNPIPNLYTATPESPPADEAAEG